MITEESCYASENELVILTLIIENLWLGNPMTYSVAAQSQVHHPLFHFVPASSSDHSRHDDDDPIFHTDQSRPSHLVNPLVRKRDLDLNVNEEDSSSSSSLLDRNHAKQKKEDFLSRRERERKRSQNPFQRKEKSQSQKSGQHSWIRGGDTAKFFYYLHLELP